MNLRIGARLTLFYATSVSGIGLAGAVALYALALDASREHVDTLLAEESEVLFHAVEHGEDLAPHIDRLVGEADAYQGLKYVQVVDARGVVVGSSRRAGQDYWPLPVTGGAGAEKTFATAKAEGHHQVRHVSVPIAGPAGSFVVQLGVELGPVRRSLRRVRNVLLAGFLAVVALSLVVGRQMSNRVLRPVAALTREARAIETEALGRRLPIRNPTDEIGELTGVLNGLLARVEAGVAQTRTFTADAAHELRTPLSVLRCQMEVLASQERAPAEYQESLGDYLAQISRISNVVNDLIMLTRADAGSESRALVPVDLVEIAGDVVEQATILAEARGLAFELQGDGHAMVRGDTSLLKQLLLNLTDNALKYTPRGGRVAVRVEERQSGAVLEVSDTGIGISSEELPRIFDRFFRAESARATNAVGSGLGLSICQWIVRLHGGRIAVASELGRGTTVTVSMPRIAQDAVRAA